jgi:hypothetical protein
MAYELKGEAHLKRLWHEGELGEESLVMFTIYYNIM